MESPKFDREAVGNLHEVVLQRGRGDELEKSGTGNTQPATRNPKPETKNRTLNPTKHLNLKPSWGGSEA
jgi:hypothetical protein